MNDIKSIEKTTRLLKKLNSKFALLHCKSEYPANIKTLRLDFINVLKNKYPNVPIGYSDHSSSIIPCISAIAKGASIIEKHFTESKKRRGRI